MLVGETFSLEARQQRVCCLVRLALISSRLRRSLPSSGTSRAQQYSSVDFCAGVDQADAAGSVWDLKAYQYDKEITLDKFKGQAAIIMNIASE